MKFNIDHVKRKELNSYRELLIKMMKKILKAKMKELKKNLNSNKICFWVVISKELHFLSNYNLKKSKFIKVEVNTYFCLLAKNLNFFLFSYFNNNYYFFIYFFYDHVKINK